MKLLLAAILVLPVFCFAQKDTDTASVLPYYGTSRIDTVRAVLLVCNLDCGPHTSFGFANPTSQAINDNRVVWWQMGYAVFEVTTYGWEVHKPIYLDENKRPLNKNIIVFQFKEIK